MRRWTTGLLALLVALSFSAPAFAQGGGASSTGTIQGKVTDSQGAVLPGVTVTATSPSMLGAQTTVTSETGNYRFPGRASRHLFRDVTSWRASIRSSATASRSRWASRRTVNVELALATLQETVTVSGAVAGHRHLGRRACSRTSSSSSSQSIPNGRDMWALLAVTPVGADGPHRRRRQPRRHADRLHGVRLQTGQVRVLIEGINTTEGTGGAGFYFDYASLEEAFLGTSGQSAPRCRTPACRASSSRKSGGNKFAGEYYHDLVQQRAAGLEHPGRVHDADGVQHSPIRAHSNEIDEVLRHRTSTSAVRSRRTRCGGSAPTATQKNAVAQPNFTFDKTFDTQARGTRSAKVTYQVNQKNKLIGYYQWGQKEQPNRLPFSTYTYTDPGQTYKQDSGSWVYKGEWNGTLSDKLYVEARYGDFGYYFPLIANRDANYEWRDTGRGDRRRAPTRSGSSIATASSTTGAATYFLDTGKGSHTFKVRRRAPARRRRGKATCSSGAATSITSTRNGVSSQVVFGAADGHRRGQAERARQAHRASQRSTRWASS